MLLGALFEGWGRVSPSGAEQLEVARVTHELSSVEEGCVFALLDGVGPESRAIIDQAIAAGACAILTDAPEQVGDQLPVVVAASVRPAFAVAARRLSGHPDRQLSVIAVTGTNGKSTIVHILGQVLGPRGGCGRIGTIYVDDGKRVVVANKTTPEAGVMYPALRRMIDNGCRYAAMEASSHGLTQARLFGIDLRYAIFTNLTRDHLDYHGDMASYLAAKQSLFAMLPAEGWAILPSDDPAGRAMPVPVGRRLFYGRAADADLRFELGPLDKHGTWVVFHHGSQRVRVKQSLMGLHNAYNLAAVLGVLLVEGVPLAEAAHSLEQVEAPPGRLECIPGPGFDVLVDYAHTPDAFDKVLTTCRALHPARLLVVFGAGGCKDSGKRPEMGAIASRFADRIYLTSDNPRTEDPEAIIAEIAAGSSCDCVRIVNRREAICLALSEAQPGDLVLVAGKGHENYQEIAGIRHPFDDRAVVREFLSEKGSES